ncbi:MAG TPA: PorT family protein [Candidatus Cryptobacteroides excrementigallinarum]|jgi:hypothetical protein|nr:PorT family protein [Candidatus Cryptobacteroides excrementigallinarum]
MKKAIIAIAALFVALSANAQIGVVAGLTSSSTNVEAAVADIKNVNQYHVGITYKIGIGNMLAIQPALIYNMKGTQLGDIAGLDDVDVNYKTGYLELPVQVQLGFGIGSIARVYGFAEPFVGYAITNQVQGLGDTVKNWDNVKNRLEYGVGLGAGVELFRHLQVSVKYFWDLGDVYGADITFGDVTKDIATSKCSGIAASVAFLF